MRFLPVVVFDLDNTLSDCGHRMAYARAKDWDAFHVQSWKDEPHLDVLHLWNNLPAETRRVIITGRNEAYRKTTEHWLKRHNLYQTCDALLMRPDGSRTQDAKLKPELLVSMFEDGLEQAKRQVAFILEDKVDVINAYRSLGFNCWQVRGELV